MYNADKSLWMFTDEGELSYPVLSVGTSLMRIDNFAAHVIKSRPLTQSKGAKEDLQRCQNYLQNCWSHESCNQVVKDTQRTTSPTRLLCISHEPRIFLYTVPQGQHPSYAALSYCWGQTRRQKRARTVMANVEDRHNDIDLSRLPQTIKDAIHVTRGLKLSYLWVDALCIIQDDERDTEMELTKMGSIYRDATVTISAACSESSVDGFLYDRDLSRAYGKVFQLPYSVGNDHETQGSVFLCERHISEKDNEFIDERAWTMQEDILSVRLLRFGSTQTTWRCQSIHETIDGGLSPVPIKSSFRHMIGPYHHGSVDLSGTHEILNLWYAWQEGVESYTRRTLSRPADKLRACAALAERFATLAGLNSTDYFAGLWKDDILAQLLWYRIPAKDQTKEPEPEPKRSLAPTWSWASVDGEIAFHDRYHIVAPDEWKVSGRARLDDSKMMSDRQGHSYTEPGPARLWLNGALRQAYYDGSRVKQSIDSDDPLHLDADWDSPTNPCQQTIWFFEIVVSTHTRESPFTVGLMLTWVNERGFERVGCFDSTDASIVEWFEVAEMQTICLI
jgi:hypothetical protein